METLLEEIRRSLEQNAEKVKIVEGDLVDHIIFTGFILLVFFALRFFLLVVVRKRSRDRGSFLRWRLTSLYITVFAALWILLPLWLSSLRGVLAILGIVGTGILIVHKEVFLNISGWLYIMIRRPIAAGNRVTIDNRITGDVIEFRLQAFTIIEVSPIEQGGQSTGRILHVPNALLFTQVVANASKEFVFNWNEIRVPLTPESDWKAAEEIILETAQISLEEISESDHRIRISEQEHAIHYNALTPTVYVEFRYGAIVLTLRHLTEPRQSRNITDAIWRALLPRFRAHDNIKLLDRALT